MTDELRIEAARLTAVSDQTIAAVTNPDIHRQLIGLLQRTIIMAEVFAEAGLPPEHVVGQLSGEVCAMLARWMVARRASEAREQAG